VVLKAQRDEDRGSDRTETSGEKQGQQPVNGEVDEMVGWTGPQAVAHR